MIKVLRFLFISAVILFLFLFISSIVDLFTFCSFDEATCSKVIKYFIFIVPFVISFLVEIFLYYIHKRENTEPSISNKRTFKILLATLIILFAIPASYGIYFFYAIFFAYGGKQDSLEPVAVSILFFVFIVGFVVSKIRKSADDIESNG